MRLDIIQPKEVRASKLAGKVRVGFAMFPGDSPVEVLELNLEQAQVLNDLLTTALEMGNRETVSMELKERKVWV